MKNPPIRMPFIDDMTTNQSSLIAAREEKRASATLFDIYLNFGGCRVGHSRTKRASSV